MEAFERERTIDVAGFSVGWSLFESARSHKLADLYVHGHQPIFFAHFREKRELKGEYAKLVNSWEEQGREITVHNVPFHETWQVFSFGFRSDEERRADDELLDATARWILDLVDGET